MKLTKILSILMLATLSFTWSCKESETEKIKESIEAESENLKDQSDRLEDRSEDLDDAVNYLDEGFDDMEDAIENFRNALKNVENPDDRQVIRERVNLLIDSLEVTINQ